MKCVFSVNILIHIRIFNVHRKFIINFFRVKNILLQKIIFVILLTCNPASPKATNLLLLLSTANWNVCKHFARSSWGGSRSKPCCFSRKSIEEKIVLNTKRTNPSKLKKIFVWWPTSHQSYCVIMASFQTNWRKLKKYFFNIVNIYNFLTLHKDT